MNSVTQTDMDVLRGEVMHCRREWRLHWHQRRCPDVAMRLSGREERRWWAMCFMRARGMLRTQQRLQAAS